MTIKRKLLIIFIIIFLLVLLLGGFIMWRTRTTINYLRNDVPKAIIQVNEASHLDSISQLIRYDDEVLTQSARNYAFTGDAKWKTRYEEYVPKYKHYETQSKIKIIPCRPTVGIICIILPSGEN